MTLISQSSQLTFLARILIIVVIVKNDKNIKETNVFKKFPNDFCFNFIYTFVKLNCYNQITS